MTKQFTRSFSSRIEDDGKNFFEPGDGTRPGDRSAKKTLERGCARFTGVVMREWLLHWVYGQGVSAAKAFSVMIHPVYLKLNISIVFTTFTTASTLPSAVRFSLFSIYFQSLVFFLFLYLLPTTNIC